MTWNDYLEQTKNRKTRPLLIEALKNAKGEGFALDLGSGALNDVPAILEAGYNHIDAVDSNERIREIAKNVPKLTFFPVSFDEFEFQKNTYNLVNAQYALPFAGTSFNIVWQNLVESLKSGGIFTGQFFGVQDGWNDGNHPEIIFHDQIYSLFTLFNIIKYEEEIADKPTAAGDMKHWHVFHVIAKKK